MADKKKNDEMLYIIGCPRSGTYLFSQFLWKTFDVAIPVETHFIPLFKIYLFLWGDLNKEKNRQKLLDAIEDFLLIWTPNSERDRPPDVIIRHSLLVSFYTASDVNQGNDSYPKIVSSIFKNYAEYHGSKKYGDKSAFYGHKSLTEMDKSSYGNPKFIHIIRDGRDVAMSWMGIWVGPKTISQAAQEWAKHVREKKKWGLDHPDRYLEIKYEDILSEPMETFGRVADFIKEPRPTSMPAHENSRLSQALASTGPHKKVNSPLDPDNKNKWRLKMSKKEIFIFQKIAGAELLQCGYEIESIKSGAYWLYYWVDRSRGLFYDVFSLRKIKLHIKNNFPLVIWLMRLIGLRPSKIISGVYGEKAIMNAIGDGALPGNEKTSNSV